MKQGIFRMIENRPLTKDVMRMRLQGDASAVTRPGQFIDIKIDGLFLRRPISVCDRENDVITIVYKVVGKGTERLATMESGSLDVLTGLGNGFDTSRSGQRPLLIAGGLGFTPLYTLAKTLIKKGKHPSVILGFNSADEVIYEQEFKDLGAEVTVCTADGSYGVHGFVTDAMKGREYSYFYTCGPDTMYRPVYDQSVSSGEFSFEQRMGCGFGACMGCSCETLYGAKRICKDGPVLRKEEIKWQT